MLQFASASAQAFLSPSRVPLGKLGASAHAARRVSDPGFLARLPLLAWTLLLAMRFAYARAGMTGRGIVHKASQTDPLSTLFTRGERYGIPNK